MFSSPQQRPFQNQFDPQILFAPKKKKRHKEVAFFLPTLPRKSSICLYTLSFWVLESFSVELSWLSREPGDFFSYHKYSLTNCQWPTWINFWGSGKIKFTTPTFISWSEMAEWEAVCSSFYRILCRFLVFECTLLAISRRIWTRVDHQEVHDTLPPSGSKRFFMILT